MTDYGFVRISTGSQDAQTQETTILKAYPDAVIVRPDTKAASASRGEHLDALDGLIATLASGDLVIVTDSSRLDRDPDQWAQMARLVQIKATGASVLDLSNQSFGSDDRLGVVMTALHQMEAADKSRTVKTQTHRGIKQIWENKAHFGSLPRFWGTQGDRYAKQAVCTDPEAVRDIYRRIADREPVMSVARSHGIYSQILRTLVRSEINYTGVIRCRYEVKGMEALEWTHKAEAVVDSALWHRANRALDDNQSRITL
jgi:DNA invertase Pin-like site-specific DNA recombinase